MTDWYLECVREADETPMAVGPFCCKKQTRMLRDVLLRDGFISAIIRKVEGDMEFDLIPTLGFTVNETLLGNRQYPHPDPNTD